MRAENQQHRQLIIDFYSAFQRQDWQAMADCYHAELSFSDPIFDQLDQHQASHMWHMLCESATDLVLHFDQVWADDRSGSARWIAEYSYPQRGRKGVKHRQVRNEIFAQFQFQDGQICRHSDHFSFWRWSSQALGPVGALLGWSGSFRRKVQQQAAHSLHRFAQKRR